MKNYTWLVFSSEEMNIGSIEYEYGVLPNGEIEIITDNIPYKYLATELQDALQAHANAHLEMVRENAALNV